MLDLILDLHQRRSLRVLCVGAHCDDIEIGCGATLRTFQRRGRNAVIDWVVLSGTRKAPRRDGALDASAGAGRPVVASCDSATFPTVDFQPCMVKSRISCESLKRDPAPDLILCHERDDRHQDHRIVNEMMWTTFRDHLILEYEIPKWDGGLGQPNVYVPVDAKDADAKVAALMQSYPSQSEGTGSRRKYFHGDAPIAGPRMPLAQRLCGGISWSQTPTQRPLNPFASLGGTNFLARESS